MIDRKYPPVSDPISEFSIPQMDKFQLSNGIPVHYIKKEKLPIIKISLMIECGSKFDPLGMKGLSNLTSMLLDEGADGLSALEISDAFDMLGSSFSVYSGSESINLTLQTLTENLNSSLDIFSKVLLKPAFNQKDFDREKRKLLTQLTKMKDDPSYVADLIFSLKIFGKNNPYSHPTSGDETDIGNIELSHTKDFYKSMFAPGSSQIVGVGNLETSEFKERLENYFGNWKAKAESIALDFPISPNKKSVLLFHKKDSPQTEIRVGHPSEKRNAEDYFQRMILNTILGGQFTSRINLNLREKKGFTYGAFSRFNYFKSAGYFYVSTSVGSENTGASIDEIYSELNSIREGVTDKEIEFAKSSIIKKFPSNFETYGQILGNLSSKVIHSLPDDYFENYIDSVNKISKDEIRATAEKFIEAQSAFTVLVGDEDKITESFAGNKYEIIKVDLDGNAL